MAFQILLLIMLSVFIVSLISVLVIFLMRLSEEKLFWIVSFAAGVLISAAFLDLLPEAVNKGGYNAFAFALMGIVGFFILERFLHWHHHHSKHDRKGRIHSIVYMVLIGDGIHNFIDGTIIAASFLADIRVGFAATIAIVLHEIPQEIGDAGILIYSGLSRMKAAILNLLSAATAFAGAILAYSFAPRIEGLTVFLIGFAAGGFIYIATVDLLPELKGETNIRNSGTQLFLFILGIALMFAVESFLGVH